MPDGTKPLPAPVLTQTYDTCVTRPQWVKLTPTYKDDGQTTYARQPDVSTRLESQITTMVVEIKNSYTKEYVYAMDK